MTDVVGAARALGTDVGLDVRQVTIIILAVLLCFFVGKGLKYALDRVQHLLNINGSIQNQLQSNLQAAHTVINEQQAYIVELRKSAAKHIAKIDSLERRLDAEELKMQKMRMWLVTKGLLGEFDDYEV